METLEQCACEQCDSEFFNVFQSSGGAYLVVCTECNETALCHYDMQAENEN